MPWEPVPAATEAGYTWTGHQPVAGVRDRHTWTGHQFTPLSSVSEEATVSMQTRESADVVSLTLTHVCISPVNIKIFI